MKKIALLAVAAATLAAPAFAQSASVSAIQLLNMSQDTVSERIVANDVGFEADTSGALGEAFTVINNSADTASELRGVNGATGVSNTPEFGSGIFQMLRTADDS